MSLMRSLPSMLNTTTAKPYSVYQAKGTIMSKRVLRISLLLLAAAGILGGCATRGGPGMQAQMSAKQSNGLKWAVEQENERRQLQAQGFPQYNFD